FIFGYILDKIGAKRTIIISLFIWLIVVIGAFFCSSIKQYYIVGIIAGLAIGSSQSSSRTMLALLTPKSKMAEFFGFYSFSGKMASIIGPVIYGEIAKITNDQRYSILSIIVFFIFGAIILATVDEKKGILQAKKWEN
ncbi:MAG: MFS transporter, partial [Candidatus Cloacimonadota bacterium]|nr:MFS transporter [Candidatus Cloacimonadota bacterium]